MANLNFKTPMFKVKIQKPRNKKKKVINSRIMHDVASSENRNNTKGYYKCEGVNLYMTSAPPLKIPDPPKKLLNYLKIRRNDNINLKCTQGKLANVKEVAHSPKKRKKINEFMAYRSYYSRFSNGLIPQLELSRILADLWHENPEIKRTWELFSEQYNIEQPNKSFPDWLEEKYSAHYVLQEKQEVKELRKSNIQQPYVEDLYLNTASNDAELDNVYKFHGTCSADNVQYAGSDEGIFLNNLLSDADLFQILDEVSSF
ncbi:HCL580Wp [Eremothecium sinecaudum]|uniref:HCL580Wp n=1 Tax=Eremothecium sinecaudum TaxID=45286 RepID=A0A109UXU9_9SACH|nr:HCL688Cp [Eremothecium sinecaudum]XP_017986567.1 HCL580Wp [Eremothecium sinecaudum]AMD19463.1 HCL688Cp [Eremothecium sinecaudum]AMD19571.1 HCL580Wp [Eremothecium sinecaudum]